VSKIINTPITIKLINYFLKVLGPKWHIVPLIYGRSSRKQIDIRENQDFHTVATHCISEKRTMLYYDRLFTIYQALTSFKNVETIKTLEVGVFQGGTSAFICELLNKKFSDKSLHVACDTFSGHSEKDLDLDESGWHVGTGTFIETSAASVEKYLKSKRENAKIIKGRFQDKFAEATQYGPFEIIHIDVDVEAPVKFILDNLDQLLSHQGMVIIDDFGFRSCLGLRNVVEGFCSFNSDYRIIELMTGQALLTRK
jgi:O-methyltransferase